MTWASLFTLLPSPPCSDPYRAPSIPALDKVNIHCRSRRGPSGAFTHPTEWLSFWRDQWQESQSQEASSNASDSYRVNGCSSAACAPLKVINNKKAIAISVLELSSSYSKWRGWWRIYSLGGRLVLELSWGAAGWHPLLLATEAQLTPQQVLVPLCVSAGGVKEAESCPQPPLHHLPCGWVHWCTLPLRNVVCVRVCVCTCVNVRVVVLVPMCMQHSTPKPFHHIVGKTRKEKTRPCASQHWENSARVAF